MFRSLFCNAFLIGAGLVFVFPTIPQKIGQTVATSDVYSKHSHSDHDHDHEANHHEHQHRHAPDEPLHTHKHQHEFHSTPDFKIAYFPNINIGEPTNSIQEFHPHVERNFESKFFSRIFRPPIFS